MSPVVIGATFDFADTSMLEHILKAKLGANPLERLLALAGEQVTFQEISAGVDYLMTFLISFINFPQLSQKMLQESVLALLKLSKKKKGRHINNSLFLHQPEPAVDASQETPEPANQESSDPHVSDSVNAAGISDNDEESGDVGNLGDDSYTAV